MRVQTLFGKEQGQHTMAVQVDTPLAMPRAVDQPAKPVTAASYGAELVGTFVLVFAITGTATAAGLGHPIAGSAPGSLSVALVNGLALAAVVAALGHVSGAHFNPAVTIGLASIGKFPWRHVPGYAVVQVVGGVVAGLATWAVEGGPARTVTHLGANAPAAGVGDGRVLVTEILITFVLVFVVTAVATDPRVPSAVAPLAIGFALAAAVFIGGPIDGAAVNPARALGPMIAAGEFNAWWAFIVGPIVGGVLAALAYDKFVRRGATPTVQ
jgi:MIP family channel proteins